MENKKDKKKKDQKKDTESLEKKISVLEQEKNDFQEKFLRVSADWQNFKRRTEEDKKNIRTESMSFVVLSLFKVIDNFDRALEHVPENIKKDEWFKGVLNTKNEFDAFLKNFGLEKFGEIGESFDISKHEALFSEPGEKDKILKVIEKGILLRDKVIRTAKVAVGNGK